jgi:SEL1 protein
VRNCHTAVELYKNVAERGKWADKLMEAYTSYKDGYVDQSALKYLFLAELGYETAQTNFAYMLDRGTFLFSLILHYTHHFFDKRSNDTQYNKF